MTISDSLPIKFWLNGQTVFNDQVKPGIEEDNLFLQKFNAGDNIELQIYDTAFKDYRINVYDSAGVKINYLIFDRTLVGTNWVYSKSFTFLSLGITDQVVSLKIVEATNLIDGAVSDLVESASGTMDTFVAVFDITGAVTDLLESAGGDISNGTYYYALFSCQDSLIYYTDTVIVNSGQRVEGAATFYYTYTPGSNMYSPTVPANYIATVTILTGLFGCPI